MLLAYSFLAPAFTIIGLFGLFPLAFAAYESTLRGLNKIVGSYDGLGNYVKAIDNLIYIVAFWLAAGLVYYAVRTIARAVQDQREGEGRVDAVVVARAFDGVRRRLSLPALSIYFCRRCCLIPSKLRGQANTQAAFRSLVVETWWLPKVQIALWIAIVLLAGGAVWGAVRKSPDAQRQTRAHLFHALFSVQASVCLGAQP